MDSNSRKFPEISFVDTDTERLVSNLISSYEIFTDRTLGDADPVRLFILWIADIIMQTRVIIDASAKQNVPRYAEGPFLDSLAEIFKDTERLRPRAATTTLRFHISAPQISAQPIPNGTRAAAAGGAVTFATTETAIIPPGEIYADAPAICITTKPDPITGDEITIGAAGNGFLPGQIAQPVDLFPFFEGVENITTTEGGVDTEDDEQFYERLRNSMESFSTAGSVGAYIYWVMTASQQIVDVQPTSPEPGVVDIRVLLENGEYPGDEMIQLIHDTLDGRVPMTDFITVSPPDVRPFDIDVVYYVSRQREENTETVIANAERAAAAYKDWQTGRMGRDINPDELRFSLMNAGVKRMELNAPAFEVVEKNEVAAVENYNLMFGGLEDE